MNLFPSIRKLDQAKVNALAPGEALELLQELYSKREILLYAHCPTLRNKRFPCPHCQTPCLLETTPTGYAGSCANCADVFRLNFSAQLIDHDYAYHGDHEND